MNIDTIGTSPGLAAKTEETPNIVSMRCKKDGCDSMEFQEITVSAPAHMGLRTYRCVKCSDVQSISVGGVFEL